MRMLLVEFQIEALPNIDKIFEDVMTADSESARKTDDQIIKVATYEDAIDHLILSLSPADGSATIYPPDMILKNLESLDERISFANLLSMYEHYSVDEKWLQIARKESWTELEAHMLALIAMDLDLKGKEKLLNAMLVDEGLIQYRGVWGEAIPYTKWTVDQEKVNQLTRYLETYIAGTVEAYSALKNMTHEQLREHYGDFSDEELTSMRVEELDQLEATREELKQTNEIFLLLNNLDAHRQDPGFAQETLESAWNSLAGNDRSWQGVMGELGDDMPIKLTNAQQPGETRYQVDYRGSNGQSVELFINSTKPGTEASEEIQNNIGNYLDSTVTTKGVNVAAGARSGGQAGFKVLMDQMVDKGKIGKVAGKALPLVSTVAFTLYDNAKGGYEEQLQKMDVDQAKELMSNTVIAGKFGLEFNTVVNEKGLGTINISVSPKTAVYVDNWNKWVELRHNNVDFLKLTPEKLINDPQYYTKIYNSPAMMSASDKKLIFSGEALVIEGDKLVPVSISTPEKN